MRYLQNSIKLGFKLRKMLFRNPRVLFSSVVKVHTNPQTKATTVTLSNSPKRNTLSISTIHQFAIAIQKVHESVQKKETKIMILNAEGPVFCSGHDLKQFAKDKKNAQIAFEKCTNTLLNIKNLPIPTLCVVNGIAAAAGFQMALTCDMLICTDKSSFSTPGVKWGLFCSTPGVQLIRSINSEKKAMQMLLFGEPISAHEAFQYGLVNKVVLEADLQKEVSVYIDRVQKLSAQVLALGKKVYRDQSSNTNIDQAYSCAIKGMNENVQSLQDCQEGLKAFSQKRHPHFKN